MLDIKYRPSFFRDVLGNSGVIKVLLSRSRNGSLTSRSYMFGGPKGSGKTTLARILARAMSCLNLDDGEPCGICTNCVDISNESSTSVEEFDAASHGTVEKMRSVVSGLDYESIDGMKRILILDEAHRLSPNAQDALLKSIEDRSLNVILCTTEPHKIRPAVRDRLEEFTIKPPNETDMVMRLVSICKKEHINYELEAIVSLCKHCSYSPRTCIVSLDSISVLGPVNLKNMKEFFRFDSYDLVSSILLNFDSDKKKFYEDFDRLCSSESPSWIKLAIVEAISAGYRESVGVNYNYPSNLLFYKKRGESWYSLLKMLSEIEKPSYASIESCLFVSAGSFVQSTSVQVIPAPPVPVQPQEPPPVCLSNFIHAPSNSEKSVQGPVPSQPIEIDGVVFTSSEHLTSLDSKIEPVSLVISGPELPPVEFKEDASPISRQEFINVFKKGASSS